MKILISLLLLIALDAECQTESPGDQSLKALQDRYKLTSLAQQTKILQASQFQIWRVSGDKTNNMAGAGWGIFRGVVWSVKEHGVVMRGYSDTVQGSGPAGNERLFFLARYPRPLTDGEELVQFAKNTGTNITVSAGTMPVLDYGIPWSPPQKTPAEIARERAADSEKAKAASKSNLEKAAQYYAELAEKGDAFAQYRLGLLYLQGKGVETNKDTAIELFKQASAQGQADAKSELKKLGL